jgi:transcriptional regulator with XRE-family HTH domain
MGARLKGLREAAGLSQAKLAAGAGVSLRSVQHYEHGKRSFNFETAVQLARALGCTLDDLAGIVQPEPPAEPGPRGRRKKGGEG